jgi:uncharacterized protein YndB with AHSA1/START domain
VSELGVVRLSRSLPFSAGDVWRALSEPELLVRWWAAGDVQPTVGHRFTLDMGPFGQQSCEVTAAEPNRLLAYTFGGRALHTTITWRLEPEGEGTLLTLEHAGFDLDTELGLGAYRGMGGGWPVVLEKIDEAIASIGQAQK